jgi:hypothetical protein
MTVNLANAKKALADENTGATPCMLALDALLEPTWFAWEPETIWLELKHKKVDVPISNREQILAGRSLLTTGRYWYDAHAFERTAIAFNNEEATDAGLEDAPVHFICWAVTEATQIYRHYQGQETLEFDREPEMYIAVQLQREGFIIPPDQIKWVEPYLDGLFSIPQQAKRKELKQLVREGWAAAPRGEQLLDSAFPETPAGVQLARLAAVHVYCLNRSKEQARQLAQLTAK